MGLSWVVRDCMTTAVPVSPTVRKVMRWVEWVVIVHCILSNLLSFELNTLPYKSAWLVALVVCTGALSLTLPTYRPLWQRRIYIAFEFFILFTAGYQLNGSVLFELFIIKACLLLPYREVILTTLVAVGTLLLQFAWRIPFAIEEVRSRGVEPYLDPQRMFLGGAMEAIAVSVFVVLLGFIFAAEQRSRRRAEILALEVESLATKLERSRIARDIHDSLGHSLTTLDVQLALAERYSHLETGKVKLQQALKMSQQLAAQCLSEARQSLQTIRQSNFDLKSALHTLSEQMRQSFLVRMQVSLPPLPQQLSYQLYLMAKEGLTNVQKHAQAGRVTLSIVATAAQVTMTISDDGCGFAVNTPVTGYGLQGIRERSQLLGGQMTITSSPQAGTQLQVTVPLRPLTHPKGVKLEPLNP